jgi:hypothetical protein
MIIINVTMMEWSDVAGRAILISNLKKYMHNKHQFLAGFVLGQTCLFMYYNLK